MVASKKTKNKRFFFSIKSRVALTLFIMLLMVSFVLNSIVYLNQQRQFKNLLSASYQQQSLTLLQQSRKRLIELGGSVTLGSLNSSDGVITKEGIGRYMDSYWEFFQIDWGLEAVTLYDQTGKKVSEWGQSEDTFAIQRFTQKVNESLEPSTTISCTAECRLYAAIPILLDSGVPNTLVLSTTLIDFVVDFSSQSDFGVALLRLDAFNPVDANVKPWGYSIEAITHKDQNLTLLKSLQQKISLPELFQGGASLHIDEHNFYFYPIALDEGLNKEHNFIILISDITEQRAAIVRNLIETMVLTLSGLSLFSVALLFMLWPPLSRINKLARLLPFLARSGYMHVRTEISKHRKSRFFIDEFELLDKTTQRLSYQLEKLEDEVSKRTQELELMALYDSLTGLANRRLFTDHLQGLVHEYERYKERFAIVFIDLDNFKSVNDTLGHDIGDELLIEASNRLKANVRESDIVARLGGDEFTLILPQIKSTQIVVDVLTSVLKSFQEPIILSGHTVKVTPSMGVSIGPDNGTDVSELMRSADLAMYQAKQQGKNSYCFFTDELNDQAHEIMILERELEKAISDSQFFLEFQPIIDIATSKVVSMEALLRWRHPEKGIITPDDFLPILETNGMINEVGERVFWLAAEALHQLAEAELADITLSVNVSLQQLGNNKLLHTLTDLITKTGLATRQFKIEITETMLMDDIDKNLSLLNGLKGLGFNLSIDDFGTGYSSLSHLTVMPVDELKIDRQFLQSLPENKNNCEVVSAIIAMAKNLNMSVVAEGIEDAEQLNFLRDKGCEYGQGYYFSRPQPINTLIESLEATNTKY